MVIMAGKQIITQEQQHSLEIVIIQIYTEFQGKIINILAKGETFSETEKNIALEIELCTAMLMDAYLDYKKSGSNDHQSDYDRQDSLYTENFEESNWAIPDLVVYVKRKYDAEKKSFTKTKRTKTLQKVDADISCGKRGP